MKAWKKGDPVGGGEIYLPTAADRAAYGQACRAAILTSAATYCLSLTGIEARRKYIAEYPAHLREDLKAEISKIWEGRR